MRGAIRGLLITAGLWGGLLGAYLLIEVLRGNPPLAMFAWDPGGKFVTYTVGLVLALGAGVGYASDRFTSGSGR